MHGHIITEDNQIITYATISARLRREARHTLGKPIRVQLAAIGLLREFERGHTPHQLPPTFAT